MWNQILIRSFKSKIMLVSSLEIKLNKLKNMFGFVFECNFGENWCCFIVKLLFIAKDDVEPPRKKIKARVDD